MIKYRAYRLFLLFAVIIFAACTSQPRYPAPARTGADFVIEVASLQLEIPRFFTYQFNGKNISFFVMRLKSGVQSYLDACASCYPHKQGYRFDDASVTCRYCGMNFPVYNLRKGIGGCYPIKLEGRIEKGLFRIPVRSLEAAADKF